MPLSDAPTLWRTLDAGALSGRTIWGKEASICLDELREGSSLPGEVQHLRGRSVVLAARDQLTTALALIELDGIASRVVLCPPDLPIAHIPRICTAVSADVIVTDGGEPSHIAGVARLVICSSRIRVPVPDR